MSRPGRFTLYEPPTETPARAGPGKASFVGTYKETPVALSCVAMTRTRLAAVLAATIATLGLAAGVSWAATSVNVPNAGGQLTGTVYICVNTANEGQQYVELGHPAPGNCAAGYLQYAANQPDDDTTPAGPAVLVNSETFAATSATGEVLKVSLPAGAHISGTPSAVDLDASTAAPDTVTVKSVDNVTGQVTVSYSAGTVGHAIQVTYDYAS